MFKNHEKIHLIVAILFMFIVIFVNGYNNVFAEELVVTSEEESNDSEKLLNQNKEIALKNIDECKEDIRKKINIIDEKIKSIKQKDEYKTYPAIRLNVDTPIFGLSSICNQKLKITSEVSTADVVRGYSIKDILKTSSLKVPSFSVGNIVVVTRDIKFDDSITLTDANTCILKLIQYYEQVDAVDKFLDKQIIKIYTEYIPKDKSQKIATLKERIVSVQKEEQSISEDILKVYVCRINDEKYNELLKRYMEINDKIYVYSKELENVLIDDDSLLQVEKNVINLEASFVSLKEDTKNASTSISDATYNFEEVFLNVRNDLSLRKKNVEKYISNSEVKKEIQNNENSENAENSENTETIKENAVEEIKVYEVTNNDALSKIEEKINALDEIIKKELGEITLKKIKGELTEEVSEETINKEEVNSVALNEKTKDEKDELLNTVINIYKDVLNIENNFYINNINLLLKNSTNKVNTLSKYTDYTNISDIKYIYLELPKSLEKDMAVYNTKEVLEINKLTSNIKEKLNKIVEIYKLVSSEYEKKVPENIKNS